MLVCYAGFISSIKVNGEQTEPGKPFDEHVQNPPQDLWPWKYDAEQGLKWHLRDVEYGCRIRPPSYLW